MSATPAAITAVPDSMRTVSGSDRIHQPSSTATTGLTNAYVPAMRGATWSRSQVYAV